MIETEYARQKLGDESKGMSDTQLRYLLNTLYSVAETAVNFYIGKEVVKNGVERSYNEHGDNDSQGQIDSP